MQVEELRTGNLIAWGDGSVLEVSREILSGLLTKPDSLINFREIPVDAESLQKLDFYPVAQDVYKHTNFKSFRVSCLLDEIQLLLNDTPVLCGALSVHQLQNALFALTGNELKYIERNELVEAISVAADSVMGQFIPEDRDAESFHFLLTVEGTNYTVFYGKDADGYWEFSHYE